MAAEAEAGPPDDFPWTPPLSPPDIAAPVIATPAAAAAAVAAAAPPSASEKKHIVHCLYWRCNKSITTTQSQLSPLELSIDVLRVLQKIREEHNNEPEQDEVQFAPYF